MITAQEKSQLKLILQSPQWQTVQRVAELTCQRFKEETVIHDSEWETLKATLLREGRIQGIRELFKELQANTS